MEFLRNYLVHLVKLLLILQLGVGVISLSAPTDVCETPTDLALVMDKSSSIGLEAFSNRLVPFLKDFVAKFDIGSEKTRVGMLEFDSSAYLSFSFDSHSDLQSLQKALDNVHYVGGSTNPAEALDIAVKHLFTSLAGDRPDVPNKLLLVTDGLPSVNQQYVIPNATLLKESGASISVIGIQAFSSAEDQEFLVEVASDPRLVHIVDDFEHIDEVLDRASRLVCDPEYVFPNTSQESDSGDGKPEPCPLVPLADRTWLDTPCKEVGAVTGVLCTKDQILSGETSCQAQCGATGQWSGEVQNITEGVCPPLANWASVVLNSTFRMHGATVKATCVEGLKFPDGNPWKVTVCTNTSEWDPDIVECSGDAVLKDLSTAEARDAGVIGGVFLVILSVITGVLFLCDMPTFRLHIKTGAEQPAT